jgi:MFS family permease
VQPASQRLSSADILLCQLEYLFMTQAILVGIGSSMLYYPVISLTPVYFNRHRGFAMGIAMAGSGAGGLVLAPITQSLLSRFGAPVTLRILGVWNLVVCVPISFVVRNHPAFRPVRPSLELAKRGTFLLQVRTTAYLIQRVRLGLQLLAAFMQAAGNIIPLYYLTTYSVIVLGFSPSTASMLLAANNAVNSVSRVSMGLLGDYVGRQNTMIFCVRSDFLPLDSLCCFFNACATSHVQVIFSGISPFAFWLHASRARFLAFVMLYGMASGGYSALLPTTIAEIYGKDHYSSANAAIYFVRGLGAVLGAPVAGALLGTQPRSAQNAMPPAELRRRFDEIAGYDGVLLLVAGVCVVFVRWFDARAKGRWKWIA